VVDDAVGRHPRKQPDGGRRTGAVRGAQHRLEENRRVSLRDLLSRDVPFTVVAAAVRYLIGMLISVRACAK
jgi:hypothetical protein